MIRRRFSKPAIVAAVIAGVLTGGAISFFWVIPHWVDRSKNVLGLPIEQMVRLPVPALHADLTVMDLHADTLMWDRDLLALGARGHVDLPRLQQGNVAVQVFSVVTKSPKGVNIDRNTADSDNITLLAAAQRWPFAAWFDLSARALYQAERLKTAVDGSGGQMRWIRTAGDLSLLLEDRRRDREKIGVLLSLEGSHALGGSLARLRQFKEAGFRILAPTHLFDNEIAGSQAGVERGGLTELGRQWLRTMEEEKLIIDLAHASASTMDQILAQATRPLLVSHTGVRGTCPNNRNLTDEQMRSIAAQGGLIGVGLWEEAVCGRDLEAVVKALRHAVDVMGADHVALGSDWDGYVPAAVDAAHIGALTGRLLAAGFSDLEIRKVMGESARDFLLRSLPE